MTVLSLTYFSVTRFLATWLFIFQTTIVFSQANCPVNLDFENGNFSNWQCLRGHVLADNSNNILQLNPVAPGDVHKIISSDNSTLDPYGRFPVSCPNGSRYSVKLGNNTGGHEAEALAYTFTIPASVNNFAIVYNYAIVLQNPGHQPHEQPRFRGRVIDVATDAEINCVSFDFAASSSLPGFKPSRDYQGVLYKDWTPVFVDLSEYAGRTVRLEFITSDCTNNQHFGYAYIDVNSVCSNNFMAASLCNGDNFLTLTAQTGFESYQWFENNNFNTVISTERDFLVDPVSPTATYYSLIVTPYPGFGCKDTLIATIKFEPKPNFEAGPNREMWCNETTQLGTGTNNDFLYAWTPADKLSNPTIPNPSLSEPIFSPTTFTVVTTHKATGCTSKDSVTITPRNCFIFVPTAFTPDGNGLNDVLKPYMGGKKLKRFSVYNRFGQLVFSTSQHGAGWNGTHKNTKLDTQVFVWVLEYYADENKLAVEKGTVSLIR